MNFNIRARGLITEEFWSRIEFVDKMKESGCSLAQAVHIFDELLKQKKIIQIKYDKVRRTILYSFSTLNSPSKLELFYDNETE